jgi:hypothetical protein
MTNATVGWSVPHGIYIARDKSRQVGRFWIPEMRRKVRRLATDPGISAKLLQSQPSRI